MHPPKSLRSVRPRLQRAFLAWLDDNRVRFRIPIRVTGRTERRIDLARALGRLDGMSASFAARLSAHRHGWNDVRVRQQHGFDVERQRWRRDG